MGNATSTPKIKTSVTVDIDTDMSLKTTLEKDIITGSREEHISIEKIHMEKYPSTIQPSQYSKEVEEFASSDSSKTIEDTLDISKVSTVSELQPTTDKAQPKQKLKTDEVSLKSEIYSTTALDEQLATTFKAKI